MSFDDLKLVLSLKQLLLDLSDVRNILVFIKLFFSASFDVRPKRVIVEFASL